MNSGIGKRTPLVVVALLSGCAGVPLDPGAARVRQIQPDWANECKLVSTGEVTSKMGYSPDDCRVKVHHMLFNAVVAAGGNAYVITYQSLGAPCLMGGSTISYEAYACPVR